MKAGSVLLWVAAFSLSACGLPVRHQKVTAGYVLFAADEPEDLSLCYEVETSCIGGVPGTISRLGWNRRYIAVERHPDNDGKRSEYYYIDVSIPDSAMNGVTGPLTEGEFRQKSRDLGLPPLNRRVDRTYSIQAD